MEVIKLGSTGQDVAFVQKMLSFLGYDLVVNGVYDATTLRSVKAFQKRIGIEQTGEIGPTFITAIKAAQKKTSKEEAVSVPPPAIVYSEELDIDTSCQMPAEQYVKQITEKKQIFLHFTAGGPSARNTINYWNSDEQKVATAYVIDGSTGKIFQAFHPDYWGWHLGVKGSKGKLDKNSIGIEICSYGPLKKKGDKYFAWPKDFTTEVSADKVFKLDKTFRGFDYFYSFSDGQLVNIEKLLAFLVKKYNIQVQKSFDMSWFEYNNDLVKNITPGIYSHSNCRLDKSDVYPDKRVLDMLNRIAKI